MFGKFLDIIRANIEKFNDIKINVYSPPNSYIENKYRDLIDKNLFLHGLVEQKKLFELIKDSFAVLHFMPESQEYIVSIKLFEYGKLARPVVSLNHGFDTETLINRNKLGYSINYKKNERMILKVVSELYEIWKKNPNYSSKPIGLDNYSYKKLSKSYLNILDR